MKYIFRGTVLFALLVLLGLSVVLVRVWRGDGDQQPEGSTGRRMVELAEAEQFMVVAAHPLASQAGVEILRQGGTAIDAAVAIQAMLTLVEPQSSGIGGGAFLLHYSNMFGRLEALDGREAAPAAVTPNLFVEDNGEPFGFIQALVGGRSVGVPGVLRLLEEAHKQHGKLPWEQLFAPAIRVANDGFKITHRLHALLERDPLFRSMPSARELYYNFWGAKPIGQLHKNPSLAKVFERIAQEGPDAFYKGELAKKIVSAVRGGTQPPDWVVSLNTQLLSTGLGFGARAWTQRAAPGFLTEQDLLRYRAKKRKPVCIDYREYRVCGHPPPTSGGVTSLQMLGMLSHFELSRFEPDSVEAAHILAEVGRLAFKDRAKYIGDPDFVKVPVNNLLDPGYLEKRSKLISLKKAAPQVSAGDVPGEQQGWLPDTSPSLPSTSHFNVADSNGNWVSMTTSVENAFGSRMVVEGFVLNNQLTDFSFVPERDGKRVANSVAPGKRPRSSMSPLIVFNQKTGQPLLSVGSAGGSRIIGYVVQTVVAVLDWGLDPQAAVALPHVLARGDYVELESEGRTPTELAKLRLGLESLGHRVREGSMNSGLHALKLTEGRFQGGVDPRREGVAMGGEENTP